MQVSATDFSDSLSMSNRQSTILTLLMSREPKEGDIYVLEDLLKKFLKKDVTSSLTACVGKNLSHNMVNLILSFYIKFKVDIPIINSIIAVHGLMGEYYKEIVELALNDRPIVPFHEKIKLKETIFTQFPSLQSINLNVYINILKISKTFTIAIYDFHQKEYISGKIIDLINKEIYNDSNVFWNNHREVYFN